MEIRKRRKFSKEFKLDLINMVKLGEKSVRELSKELDIQDVTIYSWIRKYKEDKEGAFPGEGKLKTSDEEIRKLRKQLADVTEERDILKKAISIFSKDQKKSTHL
jgi:transposase